MGKMVIPPDCAGFASSFLRGALGVECDVKIPASWDGSTALVVVRDDGGPMHEPPVFDRTLGVTAYAGTRQDGTEAMRLAARAFAALTSTGAVLADGSPVASIVHEGCTGPYPVDDPARDVSCSYLTVEWTAVGEIVSTDGPTGHGTKEVSDGC
ncbi:MAG: hypothetical protein ACLRO5_01355 [Collinsella sp.]|uniref:hypothetical protein n=1 Tax=Collinsella sp. TaxID=1965294 RepID=UPI0039905666